MTHAGAPWFPSESQKLLLDACLGADEVWRESWRRWRERIGDASPDAVSQRLLPLIYWRAGSAGLDDRLIRRGRDIYLQTLAQNLRREARLAEILHAFAARGIDGLLLKGAASSAAYYPSRGLRDMSDLDLHVRREHVAEAAAVLVQAEWRPYLGETIGQIQREMRIRHAWAFTLDREHEIDLHWRPVSHCYSTDVIDSFWAHARMANVAGVPVRVPGPTEHLFHICVHAIQLTWVPSVRWIVDATTLLRVAGQDVDWDRLASLAREARMTARLREGLQYLRQECAAPIADEAIARLHQGHEATWERQEVALHARQPPLGVWHYGRWHWWHFARLRPFDPGWRRAPLAVAFVQYVRAWSAAHPGQRIGTFVRMRVPARRARQPDDAASRRTPS